MNRRWGLAACVAVIAGLAVGLTLALRSSPGPGVPRPLTASTNVAGLSLSIPRGFSRYILHTDFYPHAPVTGYALTDFRPPAHKTIQMVFDRWGSADMRFMLVKNHDYGPSPDEVALEFQQTDARRCRFTCPPVRLHLPLNPGQPWDEERPASGAAGYRSGFFRVHHAVYYAMYWIGPDAPTNDRVAALRALRSIRPTA
jgi:hypothetical protein